MSTYIDDTANESLLMSRYKYNIWLEGHLEISFGSGPAVQALVLQLKGRSYSSTGAVAEMTVLYPPIMTGRDKPVSQKEHLWPQISMDNLSFVQLLYHMQKIMNNQEDDFLCDELTVTENILKRE